MMSMKPLIGFVEFVIKKYSRHKPASYSGMSKQITNYEGLMAET